MQTAAEQTAEAVALAATLTPAERFKLITEICETFNRDPSLADLEQKTERELDETLATIVRACEDAPDLEGDGIPSAAYCLAAGRKLENLAA